MRGRGGTNPPHTHTHPTVKQSELVAGVGAAVGLGVQVDVRHRRTLEEQRLELLRHELALLD
eukprot:7010197-Prymnesium_polylepis.1